MSVVFVVLFGSIGRAEEKKIYTIGDRIGFATEMDAQTKTIHTDLVNTFSKLHDIKIEFKSFNNDYDLQKAADNNELDFIYINNNDILM